VSAQTAISGLEVVDGCDQIRFLGLSIEGNCTNHVIFPAESKAPGFILGQFSF